MDWSSISDVLFHLLSAVPKFSVSILVLVAARFLFRFSTPFRAERDLVDGENPAAGVLFGSYLFGVALAISGTLFGRGQDAAIQAIAKMAAEGGLAIVLLRISIWVNDRFILHRFGIVKEIREDRNLGVGFCVAGSCVACGLILNGALTGFSKNFGYGLRDIAIFWLLGQAVLVFGAFIYHRIARYDVHELIEYDDNVAVGIGFGAFLVSLGLVVRASIVGAGLDSLTKELPRTLLFALFGILGVLVVNAMATLLVTAKVNYEDEVEMHGNVAVSTATACATLAAAVLLASVIQR